MSVPIQKSAADQLPGGQKLPLEGSDEQYSRSGYRGTQVFPLTGRPGAEVNNDVAASTVSPNTANGAGSRPPENVSGLNAGSGRAISVQPVDARNIEGSYKGDTRRAPGDTAKSSLAKAADNGGPRQRVGQFANNGKTPQDAGFRSFPGNTADSDAGN